MKGGEGAQSIVQSFRTGLGFQKPGFLNIFKRFKHF
jgi:hypothetical protein